MRHFSSTSTAWAKGSSRWATFSTTAPNSTVSRTRSAPASSRVRASRCSLMRVRRSASSPMSDTNSRTVPMSTDSFCKMESVSRRMEAKGVFSSCEASDTNRRRASSVVWRRWVSWLNSSASWAISSRPRDSTRWLYSPSRTRRMAESSRPVFRVRALDSSSTSTAAATQITREIYRRLDWMDSSTWACSPSYS